MKFKYLVYFNKHTKMYHGTGAYVSFTFMFARAEVVPILVTESKDIRDEVTHNCNTSLTYKHLTPYEV